MRSERQKRRAKEPCFKGLIEILEKKKEMGKEITISLFKDSLMHITESAEAE